MIRQLLIALGVLSMSGCLWGESPEEALRAEQGDYDDGEPEHRPGQPCLACHGQDYSPGGDVFVVAGTVFELATDDDENGLEGAQVSVTDAEGLSFLALTNTAGNFMVKHKAGLSEPRQKSRGQLEIGFIPTYPLTISVRFGDTEQEMESKVWRDGSCASCHRGEAATTDRVEKVWVFEQ